MPEQVKAAEIRGQCGASIALGRRGRGFKSRHPDAKMGIARLLTCWGLVISELACQWRWLTFLAGSFTIVLAITGSLELIPSL